MIKMLYNRCKDIYKFGNKYLPSAYKTQVEFRSHFSEKKVRLMVREIQYVLSSEFVFWGIWDSGCLIFRCLVVCDLERLGKE